MTWNTNTPRGLADTTAHIKPLIRSVSSLAFRSKKAGDVIHPTTDAAAVKAYGAVDALFDCLDQIDMNLDLRDNTNIPRALEVLFACGEYYFPDHYKARAKALFDRFEAMHWGGVAANDADASNASAPSEPQILMPPRDHQIWGDKGIMTGLAYHKLPSGKLSILAIPGSARSAKVYGDNNLTVGQWFPSLMAAFVAGAHGHNQKGIHYPSAEDPAYSVVISGPEYLEVNDDRWDVVFYCGTGSHENKDPEKIIEADGTQALEASIASGQPVRVLRTSEARSSRPVCGVRHDGLYDVKGSFFRYNKHGGRYLAFELRRRPGQRSRDECLHIPNVQQQTQFKKIEEGYQYQGRLYGSTTWEK
ncbi:hypothetical protein CB0940_12126 [Cercospora beticola]|uniref:YDG domain-containing protein n=1 Tax=Cercospora beticola TaxID=122368 RepID=A0A2G5GIA6_CERBT|nr:hypothetical protein CB0940_12126 [Cercospora beticola]PIA80011.1 hypothetical protein CB0940_12126 [Cercospora beticola]WPB07622.1 hypothetical protein RHO25_012283 [Cercospora beticola]CAK1356578.1 unnamed protein product [Cercospora beticola]